MELPAKSRPPRRNPRHERNRDRLLQAAVGILLEQDMASFTSTRIAEAAGLHKPAFYAHFKNVEACLEAVALKVIVADMQDSLGSRAETFAAITGMKRARPTPAEAEQLVEAIHRELRNVKEHERVYRLAWRYRHADGPLGVAVRDIDRSVHAYWTEHFLRLAVNYEVDARHFRAVEDLAYHVVGITYNAITRVLTCDVRDLRAEAERVSRMADAMLTCEIRFMLGVPSP